jgi:hypothetical protein
VSSRIDRTHYGDIVAADRVMRRHMLYVKLTASIAT